MFFRIFFLMLLLVVSVFADNGSVAVALPPWLQAILAIGGAGAIGGTSIFAAVASKIARVNKIVQDLKDAINALIVLLGQLKATVKDGPLVLDWNHSLDHIETLLKDLPLGISAKAALLEKLKIPMVGQGPFTGTGTAMAGQTGTGTAIS